MFYIDT